MTYQTEARIREIADQQLLDITAERDSCLKALDELADKSIRLSDRLHEEEIGGRALAHYTDIAWEEMSIAIEQARILLFAYRDEQMAKIAEQS